MNTAPFILSNMLINFALMFLFLRFMMQFAQIDITNPFAKITHRLTKIVDVFSHIFPTVSKGRINTSALVLMFILYLVNVMVNAVILGKHITPLELFFVSSLSGVIKFLSLLRYTLLASVVCSWIMMFTQTGNGLVSLVMQLAEPIIAPFRRIVPNVGMIDLSFLVALFSLMLLEKFIGIIGHHLWQML